MKLSIFPTMIKTWLQHILQPEPFDAKTDDSHVVVFDINSIVDCNRETQPSFSPMIVTQPFVVASTTLSIRLFVPLAKLSHSNTPTGPFHTICLALATAAAFALALSGPQSKPCREGLHDNKFLIGMTTGGQNVSSPSSQRGFQLRRSQCRWWRSRRTCQRWQSQRAVWSWRCFSQLWPSGPWRCRRPPHRTGTYRSDGKRLKRDRFIYNNQFDDISERIFFKYFTETEQNNTEQKLNVVQFRCPLFHYWKQFCRFCRQISILKQHLNKPITYQLL